MPSLKHSGPWLFFALTYVWSGLFVIPAALLGLSADEFPVPVLRVLGGIGPMVSAILLTYLTRDWESWGDYWRRVIDLKRIGIRWYAVILLTVPILTALSALVDVLFGGSGAQLEAAANFRDQSWVILPYAVFILLFGPLPEELGWRGYALDGLQVKWNALASSLILGIVWALWHLPLFYIEGTYQYNLGVGSLFFWIFMIEIISISVLYTWIYNNTQRSTLSAVLLHFMVNFIGELFELSERAELYQFLLWTVAAIMVTIIWGPKTLARRQ